MAEIDHIKQSLGKWVRMLDRPEIAEHFTGYSKTMQFVFPDIDRQLRLVFKDGKATIEEGRDENAEMSLDVSSDMFLGILGGEIDPMDAFMEGKLKPKGTMADLEKLSIFIEET
jgi:putative sterol carrier protein